MPPFFYKFKSLSYIFNAMGEIDDSFVDINSICYSGERDLRMNAYSCDERIL